MIYKIKLLFILFYSTVCVCYASSGHQNFTNILNYGGTPDGKTLNTIAIRNSIDACAEKGGGTIYFPAGTYLTGPIILKDNITLFIDAGAILLFSDDFTEYPPVKTRWAGIRCWGHTPLIFGEDVKNVAITGRGILDGQGKTWWDRFNVVRKIENYQPETDMEKQFSKLNQGITGGFMEWACYNFRPPFIQLMRCENVLIEGVTIKNSPFWNIHPVFSKNITIQDVTIISPEKSENTDGIDIDSSQKVRISNCHINVGDDCIVLKSGMDEDGREVGIPTEDVAIINCTMEHGHGGVVIGSETSGDIRNVVVSNCVFHGTDRGIRLKTRRGRGGIVENIRVSNIIMRNVGEALTINMHYWTDTAKEEVSERTPQFRNIHINQITSMNARSAGTIIGLEEMPADGIRLTDIVLTAEKGMVCQNARNLEFYNVSLKSNSGSALIGTNLSQLKLLDVNLRTDDNNTPVIDLKDVNDVYLGDCDPFAEGHPFIKISGSAAGEITVPKRMMEMKNMLHISEKIKKLDIVKGF